MSLLLAFLFSFGSFAREGSPVVKIEIVRGSIEDGAGAYRACYFCHSLKPGVHLTGPSLAGLWGKKSGRVEGYQLYSEPMKKSSIIWNEATLKAWLANPDAKIPGTGMTFRGVKNPETLQGLVNFLKIAMGPEGFDEVLRQKLVSSETAEGQLPKDLSRPSDGDRVVEIEHCGDLYAVKTADGKKTKSWEMNLDFKVNSGPRGPQPGQPARMETGSMGDRFAVFFHEPAEIPRTVKECKKPGL